MQTKRTYSPSSLAVWECGYAGKIKYPAPGEPPYERRATAQTDRGNVVHEVLRNITAIRSKSNKPMTPDEVDPLIEKYIHQFPGALQELTDIQKQCYEYAKNRLPVLLEHTEYEVELAIKLDKKTGMIIATKWDDPEAFLRGKLDMVTYNYDLATNTIPELIIYDHKTQAKIEKTLTLQMKTYLFMIWLAYPEAQRIQSMMHYTRYNHFEQGFVFNRSDKEEMDLIEREILARIRIAETRTTFEATPGNACTYCDFIGRCPATSNVSDLVINEHITEQSQAVELLKILPFAGPLERKVKRIVLKFMETYELSRLGDESIAYGYTSTQQIDWDEANRQKHAIAAEIRAQGEDPIDYMGFADKHSKRLFGKRKPRLRESMLKFIPTKTTTKFKKLT